MSRVKWRVAFETVVILAVLVWVGCGVWGTGAEAQSSSFQYPRPRFPSSEGPKSWKDVLPYASSLYQNKLAFAGYSVGIQGATNIPCFGAYVFTAAADPMFIYAFSRTIVQRHGGTGPLLMDYDLVGVSKSDAEALEKFNHFYTAEKGYMEVARWIDSWPDPKVPQNWLKVTQPDLYAQLYPPDHVLPGDLQAASGIL